MTDDQLLGTLEKMRDTMIAVATGGPRIDDVNGEYQRQYACIAAELLRRQIPNTNTYGSLWEWYGRWSSDLPSWQSRRKFIGDLFAPLLNRLRTGRVEDVQPTGWARVDRAVDEARERLASAQTEEQFQSVGLLCREVLISLGQAVYDPALHTSVDDTRVSATDAKRMLEAYIAAELIGGVNEETRRHARSALDLANALQHRRTATFRDAAMCVEATTSVSNVVAIVAGRRDPQ